MEKEKGASIPTFESGARAVEEALQSGREEAFYADASDPLHHAFRAKAAVHSGPGGMPMIGEDARKELARLADTPRTGTTFAYIHVPFCETRCLYCMFYQNPFHKEDSAAYARMLEKELALWSGKAAQDSAPIQALYFGGGTPTALEPDDIRSIMRAVKQYLPLANDCEITFEGRIHNFTDEKMEAALEGGINRFSLGVQTFNTKVRQSVMRVDDRDALIRRLEKLASFNNASVVMDLIYGFPGQTMEVWEDDLRTAASLPLDGIDCYQLNVFEKSPMARYIANGKLPPAADAPQKADMFARSVEFFTGENWKRLSNNHWGRTPRERNIYNTFGKSACDCLAFGCGAGGRLSGYSFMQERTLKNWEELVEKGEKPAAFLMAPKPNWALLRTISAAIESGSFNLSTIGREYGGLPLEQMAGKLLDQWREAGILSKRGNWYYETVAGQYWSVTMAQFLIDYLEPHLPGAAAAGGAEMFEGDPEKVKTLSKASASPNASGEAPHQMPAAVMKMLESMPKAMIIEMAEHMPKEAIQRMIGNAPKAVLQRVLGEDGMKALGISEHDS